MVNKSKVRLMTRAAIYEQGEGRKALPMNRYWRSDYISIQLIWAWVSYTAAFCVCAALWAFYKMEFLMENINKLDFPALGKNIALLYLGLLGVFLIINYVVYFNRYQASRGGLAMYNHILKRLAHIYRTEDRNAAAAGSSEAGGSEEDDDITGD